jgi:ABC-type glycerol-3-phosphate transport system substrate-binding protein
MQTPGRNRLWLAFAAILLFGGAAALLAACDLSLSPPTTIPPLPTDTPLPPQPTAIPTEATLPSPSAITLTIWTVEAFSPTQAITSGQILAQQVTDFEAAHPDVRLKFVLKKPYGKGGILDYLLTTKAVVPDLLPNLVVIDVEELGTAVQAGLIQPLDQLLPPALIADLYPFAKEACTFDGRLYGLQFQADLDHLVYNTGKMTVPPSSWPGVLSNPGPYLFPAGGEAGLVNDAFLSQYLAVRPWPSGTSPDEPFLDEESLVAVFQFYQDGISRGVFPVEILNYHSADNCWRDYLAGQAALTQVSASRYMAERNRSPNSAVAPIPAIGGPAAAISRGWVLALVASDPVRQSAAVDWMTQWLAPGMNAAWNQAAGYLPTRQSTLAGQEETDSYIPFIHQQLLAAQPRPIVPNYARVAAALQQAVEAVLTGAATPEEAAAQAMEAAQ